MELNILKLASTLIGRNLEGDNLASGTDLGGTSDRNVDSLVKSAEVDDLGTSGVQNSLLGLLPSLHMACQTSNQDNILNVEASQDSNANIW